MKRWMGFLPVVFLSACVTQTPITPPPPPTPHSAQPLPPVILETQPRGRAFRVIVWSTDETYSLDAFDQAAARAKAAGATHMVINDNLPRAKWEYDAPGGGGMQGDPYPAWYDYRPSVLKLFTPAALKKYILQDYATQAANILAQRSAILAKHGLRGLFQANEPQVLPEAVFTDHPLWRGPRVDQANRSKQPHFAPCVDEPDVLALYRESLTAMLQRCPQIDLFRFVTTDAGSGFCWAPSLYPGANGPAACKDRPVADRVRGFLEAVQTGARTGGANVEVRLVPIEPEEWMIPTFADPLALAAKMPPGTAIGNIEAPGGLDGPYMAAVGWSNPSITSFYPVRGIPNPAESLAGLRAAFAGNSPRLTYNAPRGYDDLYARLLQLVKANPPRTAVEEATLLTQLAAQEVGPDHAEDLVQVWQAIAKANDFGTQLKFAYPTVFGGVHQRWLVRPFLPFPNEQPAAEKAAWRPFLLSAKSETQANDLVDMQAMHLFQGWSGRMWVLNVFNRIDPEIRRARGRLAVLIQTVPAQRAALELLDRKLHAFELLAVNTRDAVDYQAALDYLKQRAKLQPAGPDLDPPLGTLESWDRRMILEIARREIDNTAALLDLIASSKDPLIDTAPTPDQEDITWLGPNLAAQLKQKIDVMNAHWNDYNRLTTIPNP